MFLERRTEIREVGKKEGVGGGGAQKRRWKDNARKIIGPRWSIQQDGGGGD